MKMNKPIDIILNYVPHSVVSQMGESWVKEVAMQAFRAYSYQKKDAFEYVFGTKAFENHQMVLNVPDIVSIRRVLYYSVCPYETTNPNNGYDPAEITANVVRKYNFAADTDDVLIIQQQTMVLFQDWISQGSVLSYIGNHAKFIECYPDKNYCTGTYSTNNTLSYIRTSIKEGFLGVVYKRLLQDEDNNLLIPNDDKLLLALGTYVISKYYESEAITKPNLMSLSMSTMQQAMTMLTEYKASRVVSTLDPRKVDQMANGKYPIGTSPLVSGNYRNQIYNIGNW